MKIAVSVFTFNRPWHTQKVLDGLKENTEAPDILYIFQDGPDENRMDDWEKVNEIITEIDWCEKRLMVSDYRKGLANSIIDGIRIMLSENDAVIVLEDDCVPHPLFMRYMKDCLEYYHDDKRVFSINGYSGFRDIDFNIQNVYFSGRASSWGWATWGDRWKDYNRDYLILNRIKTNNELYEWYKKWGEDLEGHLYGNISGKCDSWAVFWALKIIENKAVCVTPAKSLIENIGTDGSGRHRVFSDNTNVALKLKEDMTPIKLSKDIVIREDVIHAAKKAFTWTSEETKLNYYNSFLYNYTLLLQKGKTLGEILETKKISKIFVWGCGKFFDVVSNDIERKIEIAGIVLSNPCIEEYKGYEIVSVSELKKGDSVLVIPGYDIEGIKRFFKEDDYVSLIGINELLENII